MELKYGLGLSHTLGGLTMLCSTAGAVSAPIPSLSGARGRPPVVPPVPNAPFDEEHGFYRDAGFWLYGNVRLLRGRLASVNHAHDRGCYTRRELDEIERGGEEIVLAGTVLVTGIHNPGQMQAAIVPLRWGACPLRWLQVSPGRTARSGTLSSGEALAVQVG